MCMCVCVSDEWQQLQLRGPWLLLHVSKHVYICVCVQFHPHLLSCNVHKKSEEMWRRMAWLRKCGV